MILHNILKNLDFADDLALLSHRIQDMRDKTQALEEQGVKVDLKINATRQNCDEVLIAGERIARGGGRVHVPREHCEQEGRN